MIRYELPEMVKNNVVFTLREPKHTCSAEYANIIEVENGNGKNIA